MSKTFSAIPDQAAVMLDANRVVFAHHTTVLCWSGWAVKLTMNAAHLNASVTACTIVELRLCMQHPIPLSSC